MSASKDAGPGRRWIVMSHIGWGGLFSSVLRKLSPRLVLYTSFICFGIFGQ